MTVKNIGASVRTRIHNKAKADQVNTQFLLMRYALERLLYRLAVSKHRDNFLLKGALLFDLWYDVPLRPTRDIDLLGFGIAEIPHLMSVFEDLCAIEVEDGINFDRATIKAEEIHKDANYSGTRVILVGSIGGAKFSFFTYSLSLRLLGELAGHGLTTFFQRRIIYRCAS